MTNGQFQQIQVPTNRRTLLYLPSDYNEDKKYPLLVFLHGMGEAGSDINRLRTQGLPKVIDQLIAQGKMKGSDLDKFIIVAQQFVAGSPYSPNSEWTNTIIEYLKTVLNIDTNRLYLTGLSAGGNIINTIIMDYPDKFAAVVPMSAKSWIPDIPKFSNTPSWFLVGKYDTEPFKREILNVTEINKLGKESILTVYPGGHCCWPTYYDPNWKWTTKGPDDIGEPNGLNLYEWLLKHTLDKDEQIPAEPEQPEEPEEPEQPVTPPNQDKLEQPAGVITGSLKDGKSGIILTDSDEITLDASHSTGTIDKYAWGYKQESPNKEGKLSVSGDNMTATGLTEGEHIFYVTVSSDKIGWPSSDMITVMVQKGTPEIDSVVITKKDKTRIQIDNPQKIIVVDKTGSQQTFQ